MFLEDILNEWGVKMDQCWKQWWCGPKLTQLRICSGFCGLLTSFSDSYRVSALTSGDSNGLRLLRNSRKGSWVLHPPSWSFTPICDWSENITAVQFKYHGFSAKLLLSVPKPLQQDNYPQAHLNLFPFHVDPGPTSLLVSSQTSQAWRVIPLY